MKKPLWLTAGLAVFVGLCVFPKTASAQMFTWSESADQSATQFNNTDAPPATGLDSSGNFWYDYSDCNGHTHWYSLLGTSMDNLIQQSEFDTQGTSGFSRPNGDDEYWLSGMWIDPSTQTWYGIVHVEYDYNQWSPTAAGYANNSNHFRRISLVESTNQGQSWTMEGDIITPDPADTESTGTTYYFGDGDPHLYVDSAHGYFYLFYMTKWMTKSTGQGSGPESIMVARDLITNKMASGTWEKWDNGSWSQPGLQGDESAVLTGDTCAVSWNPYLGQYLGMDNVSAGYASYYTCPDLSAEVWTLNTSSGSQYFSGLSWYNWTADTASTLNSLTTSNCFRVYSANNDAVSATDYMWMTLSGASYIPNLNSLYSTPQVNNWTNYQIIDRSSGLALAVNGASTSSGAQIVQETPGTGAEQQWVFENQGSGYYFIKNVHSGLVLDVASPVLDRGENIIQSAANGSVSDDQWALEPTENGYYKLYNRNTRVIGLNGSTPFYYDEYFGAQDQEFNITPESAAIPNGVHTLTPQNATASRLDAAGGGTSNGTNVDIWQSNGGSNQSWRFTNMGGNTYLIQPSYDSSLCLDVVEAGTSNGTYVDLWPLDGGSNQLWTATNVSGNIYTFSPVNAPSEYLDVAGSATANGTQVEIWQSLGATNQEFAVN